MRYLWLSYQQIPQIYKLNDATLFPVVVVVNSDEVFLSSANTDQIITVMFENFDARATFGKEKKLGSYNRLF